MRYQNPGRRHKRFVKALPLAGCESVGASALSGMFEFGERYAVFAGSLALE